MIMRQWQTSTTSRLEAQGIQACKTRYPRKCQLCGKHQSRFRRKCPNCGRLVAPGCQPLQCWSDELIHCRNCHTLIGTLKHIRFRVENTIEDSGAKTQETQSDIMSYRDFPVGIQINVMIYLFQSKDFLWLK